MASCLQCKQEKPEHEMCATKVVKGSSTQEGFTCSQICLDTLAKAIDAEGWFIEIRDRPWKLFERPSMVYRP